MNKRINICPTALDMAGQAYQGLGEQKTAIGCPSPAPQGQGGWVPLDGQVCGEEVGEKGKWSASCTVGRSRAEDMVGVRNRLIRVAYTVTWGHMMS